MGDRLPWAWSQRSVASSCCAKYRTGNDEHDIVVCLAEPHRNVLSALQDLVVVADGGAQIPLLSVARWEIGDGLGSIVRKDMDRIAAITSHVRAGHNQNAVLGEVQATLADFNPVVEPGITLSSVTMSTMDVLLLVFNMPFVIIVTGVGIISLAGIVVNNAIVLIDYIDLLREWDGVSHGRLAPEAVSRTSASSSRRARPCAARCSARPRFRVRSPVR
jgi:multidrug efflux pump